MQLDYPSDLNFGFGSGGEQARESSPAPGPSSSPTPESFSSSTERWEFIETAVVAFLLLMDQLALAPLLLGSPRAPSLLVAPIPGVEPPAEAGTAADFVKQLQVGT